VTCDFDESLPVIAVDRHKVIQILINLLHNAGQSCSESGVEEPWIRIRVSTQNGTAHIAVADNGTGIPQNILGRLFQHGFTTRKHGHGFGLHSASLAARGLGGTLRASSDGRGKGAEFILQLPLESAHLSDSRSHKTHAEAQPILVS
jgi:C4-dicarboxylate-specific signal transduction histidine kinase